MLKKDPMGKEVLDDDRFTFDRQFTHNLYKIKINQIQIKETVEENKRTNDQVPSPSRAFAAPLLVADFSNEYSVSVVCWHLLGQFSLLLEITCV